MMVIAPRRWSTPYGFVCDHCDRRTWQADESTPPTGWELVGRSLLCPPCTHRPGWQAARRIRERVAERFPHA